MRACRTIAKGQERVRKDGGADAIDSELLFCALEMVIDIIQLIS